MPVSSDRNIMCPLAICFQHYWNPQAMTLLGSEGTWRNGRCNSYQLPNNCRHSLGKYYHRGVRILVYTLVPFSPPSKFQIRIPPLTLPVPQNACPYICWIWVVVCGFHHRCTCLQFVILIRLPLTIVALISVSDSVTLRLFQQDLMKLTVKTGHVTVAGG